MPDNSTESAAVNMCVVTPTRRAPTNPTSTNFDSMHKFLYIPQSGETICYPTYSSMAELHSILEIGVACIIDETSGVVVKLSHLHRLVKYLPTNVDLAIRCLIEIDNTIPLLVAVVCRRRHQMIV